MADFDPRAFVSTLPSRPGVYRMLDAEGKVIYVGKAANLKSRVGSYFRADVVHPKVVALVKAVRGIEVTIARSEVEALLLEFNLIKHHQPRYNVLLRDGKSFPYLHLSDHDYPRLSFYRGSRKVAGRLFGPYPDAVGARQMLHQLQKLFHLRPCKDAFFANRSRACLQYQIRRCSGPCVGHIAAGDYARDVAAAAGVLEGHSDEVTSRLAAQMEAAAERLDFERAAALRDQVAALKKIQAQQVVTSTGEMDVDIVGIASASGEHCVAVMFVRGGRNLGTTNFFPRAPLDEPVDVLGAFVTQFYLNREPPPEILTSLPVADAAVLAETLSERGGRRVTLREAQRGLKHKWVEMTLENAANALTMRSASRASIRDQLEALRQALKLEAPPLRIECFDISHTQGEATVASCVVFGPEGPAKQDYRRYNIEGITPGDDYGAMHQALTRRFKRVRSGESPCPDVLLIDGGPGQLAQAVEVLAALEVVVPSVIGVAKGADRRAGQERLFLWGQEAPSILPADSKALHMIQRVRDEAHRFAITGHRKSRSKSRQASILETIPGLGPTRRREILRQFGGLQGVMRAGIDDLAQVRGISRQLAETLYEHLHPGAG
ncbi:MAG: excinuclease ABC subunit UvrC [Gammaproteobacteria bacterium]|nr:excinuclease ABC subunit UvrC [Gammaproteobacteria bacterium]